MKEDPNVNKIRCVPVPAFFLGNWKRLYYFCFIYLCGWNWGGTNTEIKQILEKNKNCQHICSFCWGKIFQYSLDVAVSLFAEYLSLLVYPIFCFTPYCFILQPWQNCHSSYIGKKRNCVNSWITNKGVSLVRGPQLCSCYYTYHHTGHELPRSVVTGW